MECPPRELWQVLDQLLVFRLLLSQHLPSFFLNWWLCSWRFRRGRLGGSFCSGCLGRRCFRRGRLRSITRLLSCLVRCPWRRGGRRHWRGDRRNWRRSLLNQRDERTRRRTSQEKAGECRSQQCGGFSHWIRIPPVAFTKHSICQQFADTALLDCV